jgi:hypothetical protein
MKFERSRCSRKLIKSKLRTIQIVMYLEEMKLSFFKTLSLILLALFSVFVRCAQILPSPEI